MMQMMSKYTKGAQALIFLIGLFASVFCSCTTGAPRVTKVNGITVSQTDTKFCGLPVYTKTTEHKSKEQQLDDLEIEKEKREQELDLKTEERQSAAAFWFGVIMFGVAVGCVFAGYLLQGWKFWGGMGVIAAILGAVAWAFEHLVPHLKWGGYALAAAAVLWSMFKLKDFDLLDRLKGSEPGALFGKQPAKTAPVKQPASPTQRGQHEPGQHPQGMPLQTRGEQ